MRLDVRISIIPDDHLDDFGRSKRNKIVSQTYVADSLALQMLPNELAEQDMAPKLSELVNTVSYESRQYLMEALKQLREQVQE